jgi:3-vinyl bacteriochlorophyllide hydratase
MQYTQEQLRRRQASKWTRVQAVLAPLQFVSFLLSVGLVWRYLASGEGYAAAHAASLVKVLLMVLITVTGMLWEKDVYDHYFLAREFFWEDVVNGISLLMHMVFVVAVFAGVSERGVMVLMAVALATYVVNFVQFAWRGAQSARQRRRMTASSRSLAS